MSGVGIPDKIISYQVGKRKGKKKISILSAIYAWWNV